MVTQHPWGKKPLHSDVKLLRVLVPGFHNFCHDVADRSILTPSIDGHAKLITCQWLDSCPSKQGAPLKCR